MDNVRMQLMDLLMQLVSRFEEATVDMPVSGHATYIATELHRLVVGGFPIENLPDGDAEELLLYLHENLDKFLTHEEAIRGNPRLLEVWDRLAKFSRYQSDEVSISSRYDSDREVWMRQEEIRRAVDKEFSLRQAIFDQAIALNESSEAALRRLQKLEHSLTIVRSETADTISAMQDEHRAAFKDSEVQAEAIVATMKLHEQQARLLLKYVGQEGASAGYDQHAKRSSGGRVLWQIITVASFIAWIVWSTRAVSAFPSADLTLPIVLRSFFAAMPFALLTGFGVLQVTRFSAAEERNRRAQLEIFAMEPLLTGLDVSDQKELRKLLIPCFYRADMSAVAVDDRSVDKDHAASIQKILEIFGKK